jgi:predicted PurR-regulated permease PerM
MTNGNRERAASAVALWIIATIAMVFFLRAAAQLLIPIVIGVLISYILEPVVAWLARHRLPRMAGASLLMLAVLAIAAWGAYSLRDDVTRAVESLPEAARRARELATSKLGSGAGASIQQAAAELRGGSESATSSSQSGASSSQAGRRGEGSGVPSGAGTAAPAQQSSSTGMEGIGGVVQRGIGSLFALAGHITVILFLVFFLLLSGQRMRDRIVEAAGPDKERRRLIATIIDDINQHIQRFLLVRLITSVVVGGLTWAVLAWMGVQHAAFWGILAGIFNSIPYFGPVIVSGGLLVVGLVQGGGTSQALQMSGAALLITSLEGWLLEPPLMGKAERMSVLAVFLGLLLWTWMWGEWGTLLAVPMLVIVKTIADHVPALKPLGRLMAP